MNLARLRSTLVNAIARAKLVGVTLNPNRPLMQLASFGGQIKDGIELLLPYGMSAFPLAGGQDVLVFQVGGTRDHAVGIGADDPSLRIPDLAAGEFGFRDQNGQQIVFRAQPAPQIEITSPTGRVTVTCSSGSVILNAPTVILGGAGPGKKVARDGDPVVDGVVQASAENTFAE